VRHERGRGVHAREADLGDGAAYGGREVVERERHGLPHAGRRDRDVAVPCVGGVADRDCAGPERQLEEERARLRAVRHPVAADPQLEVVERGEVDRRKRALDAMARRVDRPAHGRRRPAGAADCTGLDRDLRRRRAAGRARLPGREVGEVDDDAPAHASLGKMVMARILAAGCHPSVSADVTAASRLAHPRLLRVLSPTGASCCAR
jgi:hypothetical protein